MSNIKIKNASSCDRCSLFKSCSTKDDYQTFVKQVRQTADTYNSINGKVSIKCKKERNYKK